MMFVGAGRLPMELYVAICRRWSYAVLKPDPGKQRGRKQGMASALSVALCDHVMGVWSGHLLLLYQ